MNEQEVWDRFKAGSEEDFSLLYRHFAPIMLRYGNRITPDKELIRDCLQQVFFSLWKSRTMVGSPASVQHYLLKSIRNEVIKRSNRDRQHEALPENYHLEQEDSHEQTLIQLQTAELTRQRMAELLSQLPARQREVIFLKYYANLKYDEIAAIMGIGQDSVYKTTYKAITRLQQLLHHGALLLFMLLF